MTTTVDELVPSTFYIPGLSFRGQIADGDLSIIAHNANGAVQLAWTCGDDPAPADGLVTVHSPTSRPVVAQDFTEDCTVLGGACYATASTTAYIQGFRPLLLGGDMRLVCVLLADWHDECFAHRPVQP
ncbi:hypothetical protein [Amycolatopsis plumensis]|uniref:Uncharacterized protein n=1 Tax=Amycolatopsis plumensis TaxID=236508 RepID=A0ABV5U8E4_9PSEU